MATFCGQNLGAGKRDRIRIGMRDGTIMCMITCVLAAFANIFGGRYFTMMFVSGDNLQVIKYAQIYLNTIAFFYPVLGLLYIDRNALQGIGETWVPMMGGVGELAARVIVCLTLPAYLGYTGVCLASPMAWVAATTQLLVKYISMVKAWKKEAVCELQQL